MVMVGDAMRVVFFLLPVLALAVQASEPFLYESFDETFEGRWIVSQKEEYQGIWKHSKSEGHDDYGLLVSEPGKKYAIVKDLDEPVALGHETVVLQFEARLQNGLECGGAYLKYLRPQGAEWVPEDFNNESPYSIMFGPDRCGSTDKVHFIFSHWNPKIKEYVEHHLKFPPSVPLDNRTHVYTAVLTPDSEVRILVDGVEKKKASLLDADYFAPPLIPRETIPDLEDQKPEDWDERAKIPDPNVVKPDDWDEDAPFKIEDEEAAKPEGWLDNEPVRVDDPENRKPQNWDEDEDGEWESMKIDNPKCESAPGCGEWKRPMKRNPAYKGKWHPPMIENPSYKGIWKPQEIPNPAFFELDKPALDPIAAIGIEIWTMQDGILFDNILIANDEEIAELYRDFEWKPKFDAENETKKKESAAPIFEGLNDFQEQFFGYLYMIPEIRFLKSYKYKLFRMIERGEKRPNLTIGSLVSLYFLFLTTVVWAIGKKLAVREELAPEPAAT